MKTKKKNDKGLSLVELMIDIYYDKNKNQRLKREDLKAYVKERLRKCPHGDAKPSCSSCKIHCYDQTHRDQIRRVMRFSGPRMIFYAPGSAVRHFLESKKE